MPEHTCEPAFRPDRDCPACFADPANWHRIPDAACTCGPGPVGGAGWDSQCPQHNVRELLKAPPGFDPSTLRDRLVAYQHDAVDHPAHYTTHPSGLECIEVTELMPFCLGNAVKYVWRAGEKVDADGVEDLRKAVWYLRRHLTNGSANMPPAKARAKLAQAAAADPDETRRGILEDIAAGQLDLAIVQLQYVIDNHNHDS